MFTSLKKKSQDKTGDKKKTSSFPQLFFSASLLFLLLLQPVGGHPQKLYLFSFFFYIKIGVFLRSLFATRQKSAKKNTRECVVDSHAVCVCAASREKKRHLVVVFSSNAATQFTRRTMSYGWLPRASVSRLQSFRMQEKAHKHLKENWKDEQGTRFGDQPTHRKSPIVIQLLSLLPASVGEKKKTRRALKRLALD